MVEWSKGGGVAMKGRETDLRILQRHLSGRGRKVFPNQVVL